MNEIIKELPIVLWSIWMLFTGFMGGYYLRKAQEKL